MAARPVFLERPSAGRRREFLRLERASRSLHRPWLAAPSTASAYDRLVVHSRTPTREAFFVCDAQTRALAGVVVASEIVRGFFKSAYLSYYAFAPAARTGAMTEGLALVLDEAFGRMRLHRVEANIQPGNARSIALVRRLGFRLEGYSLRYLKIQGRWRDHERWALLAEEWRGGRGCHGAGRGLPGGGPGGHSTRRRSAR